jgi:hypothetical protein
MEVLKINPVDLGPSPAGAEGPVGPTGPDSTFVTSNVNSIAAGGSGYLNTTNSVASKLKAGNQIYVRGSDPGYLDVESVTRNGSNYRILATPSIFGVPVTWAASDPVLVVGKQGSTGLNVIDRGNPGQSSPLILSGLNTVHYYSSSTPGAFMDISTGMVENGVYELIFNLKGSSRNNDLTLYPNYNLGFGANTFYTMYQNSGVGGSLQYASINRPGILFDFVGGFNGWDPVGKMTIYNVKAAKKVCMEANDTTGIVHGTGYWTNGAGTTFNSASDIVFNTGTTWLNVGRLSSTATYTNWQVWVKRIA